MESPGPAGGFAQSLVPCLRQGILYKNSPRQPLPLLPREGHIGEEAKGVTLEELSKEYREELEPLKQRMRVLRVERQTCTIDQQRILLDHRLKCLNEIYRQTRELADLLEHYYERGFYKNGKYAL